MKFETYIHKIVKNHQKSFRKDMCKHWRTWGVNVRALVLSRGRMFTPRVRACLHGSLRKICWWFFTILWIEVSNFIKIGDFVAEIFAKQYWLLKLINFQCILHISTVMHLERIERWIITEKLWIFLETRYQNVPNLSTKSHLIQLIGCFLAWAISSYSLTVIIDHPVFLSSHSC